MNAYISCPLSVASSEIDAFADILKKRGYNPYCFTRGTVYSYKLVRTCDLFVLMTQNNNFIIEIDHLTRGCKSEVLLARELGKPIYLAYTKTNNKKEIYPIYFGSLVSGKISGRSGTYLTPNQIFQNYEIY